MPMQEFVYVIYSGVYDVFHSIVIVINMIDHTGKQEI